MILIFSRHGNTFKSGDPTYWVGANEDLPLTNEGEAQAGILGETLAKAKIELSKIYTGPLQRTTKYSEIVSTYFEKPPEIIIDNNLTEIDYGLWSGLTNEEVVQRYGNLELDSWNKNSIWPKSANWKPEEDKIKTGSLEFITSLRNIYQKNDIILIVSSNGRLRYFLEAIDKEIYEKQKMNITVKTGNIGVINLGSFSAELLCWNKMPDLEIFRDLDKR